MKDITQSQRMEYQGARVVPRNEQEKFFFCAKAEKNVFGCFKNEVGWPCLVTESVGRHHAGMVWSCFGRNHRAGSNYMGTIIQGRLLAKVGEET